MGSQLFPHISRSSSGQLFSNGTPIKQTRQNVTQILLLVILNTRNPTHPMEILMTIPSGFLNVEQNKHLPKMCVVFFNIISLSVLYLQLTCFYFIFVGQSYPTVLKRLDAHYDWLPNLASVFGNKTTLMINGGDGCKILPAVNHSVAMVTSDGCSYFQKVCFSEFVFE